MTTFMTALSALLIASSATVNGLGVLPLDGRTAVVIEMEGSATVRDFALRDPARLVVDIANATHEFRRLEFNTIDRGGVEGLRLSQYRPDVVRVVIDLSRPVDYAIERRADGLRLTFANHAGAFEPWRVAARPDPVAAGRAAERRSERPAPPAPPERPEPRITVTFQQTPIQDVLATFAAFSGRSIVSGQGVGSTKISADIREQPWDVALETILKANGLAAVEMESGIIRVAAAGKLRTPAKKEPLVTRPFQIQYAPAKTLVTPLKGLLSKRGRITLSKASNTLLVTDAQSVIEDRIAPMINQLDVRRPQVTISAKIVFIDRTGLQSLGFTYDLKDSRGNQFNTLVAGGRDINGDGTIGLDERTNQNIVQLGGNSIAAIANAAIQVAQPQLQIVSSLVLGRYSLLTFIDALEQLNLTNVQAVPTVTVLDNTTARVQVGEETPVRVIDQGAGGGGQGAPRATVETQETGIILEVTPHVTGNQVLLELHAERSNVALAPSDIGITFETQETDTQVLLQDGETAVIGGLTTIETSETRSGIPILMNLPFVGSLFRTSRKREQKQDLLIMVTPHIVRQS